MTFLLTASGYFYYDEEKTELEKLGFTFKETPNSGPTMLPPWEKDRESVSVEINSLEELMAFSKKQI